MKNGPQTWLITLLATAAIGISSAAGQSTSVGSPLTVSRLRIQAAVTAAMADGRLTNVEQSSILHQGRRTLNADDFDLLRRTLDRLSKPKTATTAVLANDGTALADGEASRDGSTSEDSPVQQAGLTATEGTTSIEPIPDGAGDPPIATSSPFHQEGPVEESGVVGADTALGVSDGCACGECEAGCEPDCGPCGGVDCEDCPADIRLWTSIDAFKGPLDLENHNGNFGVRFAINGGFPLIRRMGLGVQAGTSGAIYDFHGSPFTGSDTRSQNFTTVGIYQRLSMGSGVLKYGFGFDWLTEDYYVTFKMSQWRVKLGWELNPCNEIGIWTAIPNDGDTARLRQGPDRLSIFERFKPMSQGNLYFSHCWETGAYTTTWIGIAQEPGEFVFGGDARVPISRRLALVGNMSYILPSASGPLGQEEELWNVSVGLEFTPGCYANRCPNTSRFAPLLPLADNGSFAVRRL